MKGGRTSPIDEGNLNRSFPGGADGTITQQIAYWIEHALLLGFHYSSDFHFGGSSLLYLPIAMVAHQDEPAAMDRGLGRVRAFGAPLSLLTSSFPGIGHTFTAASFRRGVINWRPRSASVEPRASTSTTRRGASPGPSASGAPVSSFVSVCRPGANAAIACVTSPPPSSCEDNPGTGGTMKKIGIVGGVGWPSTADYYRLICTAANAHFKAMGTSIPYPTPPMTIESLVMHETRGFRAKPGDSDAAWSCYDGIFRGALLTLQNAGCDFGIIANNTSHTRLHSIRRGLRLPIISILDETADAAKLAGASKALILGTEVTMRADDYASVLMDRGITPNARLPDATIDGLQSLIDTEFDQGATALGRQKLLELCREHVADPPNTTVLLACTELPLAFPQHSDLASFTSDGFRFVNTTAAHVQAALQVALGYRTL